MSKQLSEVEVLKQLDIPDFRHMTKDKVINFASMLQNMDPEVAKKVIEQFPEFVKMSLEAFKEYRTVLEKTLDASKESSKDCFNLYDKVLSALEKCVSQDEISYEEKKYYLDNMMEIARMTEKKDSENKAFYWKVIGAGTVAVISIVGLGAAALGGKFDIDLPKPKL